MKVPMNAARPASVVMSPTDCVMYARLAQIPSSTPARKTDLFLNALDKKGVKKTAAITKRPREKEKGSKELCASFTTVTLVPAPPQDKPPTTDKSMRMKVMRAQHTSVTMWG